MKNTFGRALVFTILLSGLVKLFGLGLIEGIQDSAIRANMNANLEQKRALGISGHPNVVPNNGTISRFGWKAQNGSITIFAGEAYNVEMGISNDAFPIGRSEDPDCNEVYEPFDIPRTDATLYNNPLKIMPAWVMFTEFMRFVDAPQPAPLSSSAQHGEELFSAVGCALCHTPSFKTQGTPNPSTPLEEIGPHSVALRGQAVNLFSDLLVHHMGATLADNITQGNAGPDEFRTTPLWGLGTRLFFLHDGRTSDLMVAVQDHFSRRFSDGGDNPSKDLHSYTYGPSEGNAVVAFVGFAYSTWASPAGRFAHAPPTAQVRQGRSQGQSSEPRTRKVRARPYEPSLRVPMHSTCGAPHALAGVRRRCASRSMMHQSRFAVKQEHRFHIGATSARALRPAMLPELL